MMMNFESEALNKLGSTVPELLSSVVRFENLSDNLPEDSNTSVGVFILVINQFVYLVPIVAKGDIILPIDSIYDNGAQQFRPLTALYSQDILTRQNAEIGTDTRIPRYVNVNPSVYNLIVPPRTGKYAYASTSIPEILAQVPEKVSTNFKNTILNDKAFARIISRVADIQDVLSTPHRTITPAVQVSAPGVEVLTSADAVDPAEEAVIQDLLNVGYHVRGDVQHPSAFVEESRGSDGLLQLKGAIEGGCYNAVFKDGSTVAVMVPKRIRRQHGCDLPQRGSERHLWVQSPGAIRTAGDQYLAITEYGDWVTDGEVVLQTSPVKVLSEVTSELYANGKVADIRAVAIGDTFCIVGRAGVIGPFEATAVTHSGSMCLINVYNRNEFYGRTSTVTASSGFKGDVYTDGDGVMVGIMTPVILLNKSNVNANMQTNVFSAMSRRMLETSGNAEKEIEIRSHDHGMMSFNGRALSEPEMVRMLIIGNGIAKQASLDLVKKAKEQKRVKIYLTKKASDVGATPPGEIPEYGSAVPPEPDHPVFNYGAVQQAASTNQPDLITSSVIVQFLQDPTMYDTITSYMPQILQSIDKIGRTLLLLRINSDINMPDDVSALVTALRNTYKMLGDNTLKLERLVNANIGHTG